MNAKVKAYAGSSHPETPRSLSWEGQTYLVQAVLERWREPHRLGFLVRCTPGETLFELFYMIEEDQWQIQPNSKNTSQRVCHYKNTPH